MDPQPDAVRVVIAEDSLLLREGLAGLLERFGFHTAARVGDAEALKLAVAEHAPDLVITDIRMPPSYTDEGLRAAVAAGALVRAAAGASPGFLAGAAVATGASSS